jgi:hypothetical protein
MQNGYIVCENTKGVLPPSKYDPLLQRTAKHYEDVRGVAQTVSNQGRTTPTNSRRSATNIRVRPRIDDCGERAHGATRRRARRTSTRP